MWRVQLLKVYGEYAGSSMILIETCGAMRSLTQIGYLVCIHSTEVRVSSSGLGCSTMPSPLVWVYGEFVGSSMILIETCGVMRSRIPIEFLVCIHSIGHGSAHLGWVYGECAGNSMVRTEIYTVRAWVSSSGLGCSTMPSPLGWVV